MNKIFPYLVALLKSLDMDAFLIVMKILRNVKFPLNRIISSAKYMQEMLAELKDHPYQDMVFKHLIMKVVHDWIKTVNPLRESRAMLHQRDGITYLPITYYMKVLKDAGLDMHKIITNISTMDWVKYISSAHELYTCLELLSFDEQITLFNRIGCDNIELLINHKLSNSNIMTNLLELHAKKALDTNESFQNITSQFATIFKQQLNGKDIVDDEMLKKYHTMIQKLQDAKLISTENLDLYIKANQPEAINELIQHFAEVNFLNQKTFEFITKHPESASKVKKALDNFEMSDIDVTMCSIEGRLVPDAYELESCIEFEKRRLLKIVMNGVNATNPKEETMPKCRR